jgi:enoyl-CoA hydratase/carnithine racemase
VATGRSIGADEALRLGLVSRVVPAAELDTAGAEMAAGLAAAGASAMGLTKRLFYELDGLDFDAGIALGARVNAAARATPEFRDALRSFLKK